MIILPTLTCMFILLYILFVLVIDSFAWILSWLSLSMLSLLLFILIFIFLFSLYVDMDDIPAFCLTTCCMIALLLCVCMLFVHVGRISILLPPIIWSRSFPSFRFLHLQVWGLVCACFFDQASWLGVGSSNGLYQCLGAFWGKWTYWRWLESDLWRLV